MISKDLLQAVLFSKQKVTLSCLNIGNVVRVLWVGNRLQRRVLYGSILCEMHL